ncbi:unnamed protein product [Anisakis simplex]|uniref:Uncharacterized protein n=1 Tax=Anisakis simplex TaxID=6269 RepID=A0A0M3K952_ANISI|nr:unnamed protein product [Anisakis simplex]
MNDNSAISSDHSSTFFSPDGVYGVKSLLNDCNDAPLATSSPIPPSSSTSPTTSYLHNQSVRPSTSQMMSVAPAVPSRTTATSPISSNTSCSRPVPPPVAPKPKLTTHKQNGGILNEIVPLASLDDQLDSEKTVMASSQVSTPSTPNSNPERMAFSSKLKKFEREIEIKRTTSPSTATAPLLPGENNELYVNFHRRSVRSSLI